MQRHSHYATAAMQHSQSCNGSKSCSSILSAIALSHYEFLILLFASDICLITPSVTLSRNLASAYMYPA